MTRLLTRLRDDERGATAVEFAFIAPVLFLVLMGTFDLSYRTFIHATLQGEVQKAARDGTLEGGASALSSLDARIENRVKPMVSNATFAFDRKKYTSFSRAGQAENFTDGNGNGVRDAGECFQDENGNGAWDPLGGVNASQGGSNDIVQYKVTVTYPRIIPMEGVFKMMGITTTNWGANQTISSTTVLRNQPFGAQAAGPTTVAVCT
jgi:Flp pilus assembly protein TadG